MTHEIRDYDAYKRNLWEWDKWGFTEHWDDGCTLSDIDGFYPHFAEVSSKFLIVEVKNWNNELPLPEINYQAGQTKALMALSKLPQFTVIWAFGDTGTKTIYDYKVFRNGETLNFTSDFKDFITGWFKWARNS